MIAEVRYTVEAGLLILTLCILIGPLLAERIRIPGLIGLIFMGMVLGPYALEWIRPDDLVATVGAAGLLYLMFLAGVELDLRTFLANRTAAISFGLLTFALPFLLGAAVGAWHLDLEIAGVALVGAMWASHTLVAYPEVKAAGLDTNRAVGSAVAATVITDVLALVILALTTSSAAETDTSAAAASDVADDVAVAAGHSDGTLPLWAGLVLLVVFSFVILPRLTRWVFVHMWHTRTQRFVWVLAAMSAGGVLSLLGGIEGLVGAFLAGIGMNTSIPARGELMEHIEFFGAALLVPAFLVSVGLSIDPAALMEPSTLALAAIFTAAVVVGKVLAAVIAGRIFGFSWPETWMMAALTIGQAAATLAIAQVGVANGIIDQEVLNAAVVTVVATVLITSFGTRAVARRIEVASSTDTEIGDCVLVQAPIDESQGAVTVAARLAAADGGLVTPYIVARDRLTEADTARLDAAVDTAVRLGQDTHGVSRVDGEADRGTIALARELDATLLVVPWPGTASPLEVALTSTIGSSIDRIGAESPVPVAATFFRHEEWTRVITITGTHRNSPTRLEDIRLAVGIGDRLRRTGGSEHIVRASDALPDGIVPEETDVSGESAGLRAAVAERSDGTELLVVPGHVLRDARIPGRFQVQRMLQHRSLIVVAGPGRLTLGGTLGRSQIVGAMGPARSDLGPAPARFG